MISQLIRLKNWVAKVVDIELLKYLASGLLSGVVMITTALGMKSLTQNANFSTICGVIFSFLVSFLAQRYWVFNSDKSLAITGARFAVVTALTWMMTSILYFLMWELGHMDYLLVQIAVFVFVSGSNYLLNRLWTFKKNA